MIQQPELGKKIADLRKAKGLTQEELVEKCNLSVRTLQRIEAGEVMPRTYTVKLIFEALEINYDNSFNDNKRLISKWLEQFYISFIDLFNLKTNTMRKITILSVMVTAIVFGITSFTNDIKAQKESEIENHKSEKSVSDDVQKEKIVVSGTFNGWDNHEEFNARDAKCTINGVFFKSPMIILDKETHEFHTYSAKGILFKNKLEIKRMISKPENSADNIEIN